MPVAPCRTVASPETAQRERPYPRLAPQASAHRARLPRESRPQPRNWARSHRRSPSPRRADSRRFLPGRTRAHRDRGFPSPSPRWADRAGRCFLPPQAARAVAAGLAPPDGAQPTRQADPGSLAGPMVGSKPLQEAIRQTPAHWTAAARPWKGPPRRPDARDRGRCARAVRCAKSPAMSPPSRHHSRHHRVQFWSRPPPPAKA